VTDNFSIRDYLLAWERREQAARDLAAANSTMVAKEMRVREVLGEQRGIEVTLDRTQYKVSIAPNGRDIMVLPWKSL
jgi:hypothetical protein